MTHFGQSWPKVLSLLEFRKAVPGSGGAGADSLTGGIGADTFAYASANDSTETAMDVLSVDAADVIDLSFLGAVLEFATVNVGHPGTGVNQDVGLHFVDPGANLAVNLINYTDVTYLAVDVDDSGTYDAGTDMLIQIVGSTAAVLNGTHIELN